MSDLGEHAQWLSDYNEQLKLYDELYNGDKSMNINEAFPSKYLKAADLKGKKVIVKIAKVEFEQFEDNKPKPIIYFENKEKGLVGNKTNCMVIASGYGPETNGWIGKEIALYTAQVPFQGQMTDALRVELPQTMATDDTIPDF